MRQLFLTLIILCSINSLFAQSPYQKWVLNVEGDKGQMEFFKDDKITLQKIDNIQKRTLDDNQITLQIAETVQMGKSTRFIVVEEREGREGRVGIIQCFDITKDQMNVFVMPRHSSIKSVEDAKNYKAPKNIGLKCYSWDKAEEITKGKDIRKVSKKEAISFLKKFKERLNTFINDKEFQKLGRLRDGEIYLESLYFEVWKDMGYNIFLDDIKPGIGIEQFEEDKEVKKYMKEIEEMVEGSFEEENIEMPEEKYEEESTEEPAKKDE